LKKILFFAAQVPKFKQLTLRNMNIKEFPKEFFVAGQSLENFSFLRMDKVETKLAEDFISHVKMPLLKTLWLFLRGIKSWIWTKTCAEKSSRE